MTTARQRSTASALTVGVGVTVAVGALLGKRPAKEKADPRLAVPPKAAPSAGATTDDIVGGAEEPVGEVESLRRTVAELQAREMQWAETERELAHQATHDDLTGLGNRVLLGSFFEESLKAARQTGESLALLFCDLDQFKDVNDTHGHQAGDQALQIVADRLAATVPTNAAAFRFGGDEFIVVLPGLRDIDDSAEVAQSLINAMKSPCEIEGDVVHISVSIGIAIDIGGRGSLDRLLTDADVAAYRAKENGRDRFQIFDDDLREWVTNRQKVAADLRQAVRNNELELHYQPIIDMRTSRSRGSEAFVRWNRPGHGLVRPDVFIALAEDTGLIFELGQWVIEQSCRDLAALQKRSGRRDVYMSVNLSARQLAQPDLISVVVSALDNSGADPAGLRLELTEKALLNDIEHTIDTLNQLRNLGIGILIDDFGTGYSSITHLQKYPVDALKIDGSFVADLEHGETELVQLIINLGHGLGIPVSVEAVETVTQHEHLKRMMCDRVQGSFYGRPVPLDLEQVASAS